jgi:hypothetical protein
MVLFAAHTIGFFIYWAITNQMVEVCFTCAILLLFLSKLYVQS